MAHITNSKPPIPKRPRPPYRGSSTARGYDEAHKRLRLQVLAEQPVCSMCLKDFSHHLHHIDGDCRNTARENVTGLCERCHMRHHAK
jgi:5-methylcytosine-specific restriction endonuclease McrA